MAGMGVHLRRNVVAYVALFLSFTGTATALVVTGEIVKDDSLTGADIREPTLAEVPRAAEAAVAGDADTLDGEHAADLPKVLARRGHQLLHQPQPQAVTEPIAVPEGARVSATASIQLVASPVRQVKSTCWLLENPGGTVLGVLQMSSDRPGLQHFSLSGATAHASGSVTLECSSDTPGEHHVNADLVVVTQGGAASP